MRDLTKSYFESQQDIIAPSDIDIVNNEMFESIQVLFDAWAAKLPKPDLTIECKIVNNDKALSHWYTVITNNNQQLEVQGENVEYKVGEKVLVVIPEGDYSKRKRIIGRYYDEIDIRDEDSSNQDYYFELIEQEPTNSVFKSLTLNTVDQRGNVGGINFTDIPEEWDIDSVRITMTISSNVEAGKYWIDVVTEKQEGDKTITEVVCSYEQWTGNYNQYDNTVIYDYIILPNQKYYDNLKLTARTSNEFKGEVKIGEISIALCHSQKEPIYLYKEGDFDILDTIHTDLNFIKTQLWLSAIAPFNYITGTVSGNILDANQGYMAHLPVKYDGIFLDTDQQLDTQQDMNISLVNSTLKHAADLNIIKDSNFNNLRWLTMHPMNQMYHSLEGYGIRVDLNGKFVNPYTFCTVVKWEQPYESSLYINDSNIATLTSSSKKQPSYYYLQFETPTDSDITTFYLHTSNQYRIEQSPFPSNVSMTVTAILDDDSNYSTTLKANQFSTGMLVSCDVNNYTGEIIVRYSANPITFSLVDNSEETASRSSITGRIDMDYSYRFNHNYNAFVAATRPRAVWFTYQAQRGKNVLSKLCHSVVMTSSGGSSTYLIILDDTMKQLFKNNHGTQMSTYVNNSNLVVDFTQGFSCLAPVLLKQSAPYSKLLLPPQLADKYDLTLREMDNQVHKRVEWYHLYEPANRWDLLPFEPSTIHNIEKDKDDNEIHTFDLSKRYRFLQDGYGKFKAVVYIDDKVYESNILTINPPEEEKEE